MNDVTRGGSSATSLVFPPFHTNILERAASIAAMNWDNQAGAVTAVVMLVRYTYLNPEKKQAVLSGIGDIGRRFGAADSEIMFDKEALSILTNNDALMAVIDGRPSTPYHDSVIQVIDDLWTLSPKQQIGAAQFLAGMLTDTAALDGELDRMITALSEQIVFFQKGGLVHGEEIAALFTPVVGVLKQRLQPDQIGQLDLRHAAVKGGDGPQREQVIGGAQVGDDDAGIDPMVIASGGERVAAMASGGSD